MKIAFASGKGGTGKTTVTVNLATLLAQSGLVTLCDFDVEEPNSHLFINGSLAKQTEHFSHIPTVDTAKCTGCGLCRKVCNFNAIMMLGDSPLIMPQLCHSCYACSELCPAKALDMQPVPIGTVSTYKQNNLTFTEARLHIGQEQAPPLINQVAKQLNQTAKGQILLIDSPPGTACPVVQTMRFADYIILVTEPTPFGANDLHLAVLTAQAVNKPFAVVINKDDGQDNIITKYCQSNGYPIAARIPLKRSLAQLYATGKTLLSDQDVYRQMQQLASFLQKQEAK